MTNQDLAVLRKSLDDIDAVLVSALGERARLARQIAQVKADGDGPVRDADRETALLQHRSSFGERLGLDPAFVRRIFREILDDSVRRQQDALQTTAALVGVAPARVIHQNLTHGARRDGEEVRAVLPVDRGLVHQSQVGLVDQCRRLQRVTDPLLGHLPASDVLQLGVDDRQDAFERGFIALTKRLESKRQIVRARWIHTHSSLDAPLAAVGWHTE